MGMITTISFYNDAYGEFEKHPDELVAGILAAMNGEQLAEGRNYFSVGCHANPVTLQKPRHAQDRTLYLFDGNTVIDIDGTKNEWAVNSSILEMEYQLKRLKELKKNLKKTKTNE